MHAASHLRRYLERLRDPWREAHEEVEARASALLLAPASRDFPAVLALVYEADLVHAAQVSTCRGER